MNTQVYFAKTDLISVLKSQAKKAALLDRLGTVSGYLTVWFCPSFSALGHLWGLTLVKKLKGES